MDESELHRRAYEAGDRAALMLMLRHCLMMHLPLPQWVQQALLEVIDQVGSGALASWDEGLGKPRPKGLHSFSTLLDSQRWKIWAAGQEMIAQGAPIDEELFQRLGKQFNASATAVRERYYRVDRVV